MKTYEQMAADVLRRRNEELAEQAKKHKNTSFFAKSIQFMILTQKATKVNRKVFQNITSFCLKTKEKGKGALGAPCLFLKSREPSEIKAKGFFPPKRDLPTMDGKVSWIFHFFRFCFL